MVKRSRASLSPSPERGHKGIGRKREQSSGRQISNSFWQKLEGLTGDPRPRNERCQGKSLDFDEAGVVRRKATDTAMTVPVGSVLVESAIPVRSNIQNDQQMDLNDQDQSGMRSPISQPNPDDMGCFARLSPKLRKRIWKLVLVWPNTLIGIATPPNTCSVGPCGHSKLSVSFPGIVSTCRQIRSEAMPIFCRDNRGFFFDAAAVRNRCAANWLRALGPYGRLLGKVVLQVDLTRVYGVSSNVYNPSTVIAIDYKKGWFTLRVPSAVRERAYMECRKLEHHVGMLNKRIGKEGLEELLLELVWSDWLADVVYRCEQ